MKKQNNSKQMLFEMMSKIDPTFKSKLNENSLALGEMNKKSIRDMNDIEFKQEIKKHVDNGDFDSFHYLLGNAFNENRHELVTHFIFDFDADYSLSKHIFNELTKIKDSGFWNNHMNENLNEYFERKHELNIGGEGKRVTGMDLTPEQRQIIYPIIDKYVKKNQDFVSDINQAISHITNDGEEHIKMMAIAFNQLGDSLSANYFESIS